MKLINITIPPASFSDVRADLERVGVRSFGLRESSKIDPVHPREASYRGVSFVVDAVPRLELWVTLHEREADAIVSELARNSRSAEVVISSIDAVVSLPERSSPRKVEYGSPIPAALRLA